MASGSFSKGDLHFRSYRMYMLIREKQLFHPNYVMLNMLPAIGKKVSEISLLAMEEQSDYDDENPETDSNCYEG